MKEVYLQTAQTVSDEYLNKILIEGRWADKVLSYLEKAPFSFSISSADREAKGFPIVYVNGAFESTTRYERSEVIGRGHGFLRSPNTEEDQLMKIADALSKGEGCKIAITNRRKNGVDFLNFLALRPVLSRDSGDYKYVIAVQYDITNAEASLRQMKMFWFVLVWKLCLDSFDVNCGGKVLLVCSNGWLSLNSSPGFGLLVASWEDTALALPKRPRCATIKSSGGKQDENEGLDWNCQSVLETLSRSEEG
eukprot:scaffold2801_cov161-Ochromonas_danica.AAC.8